MKKTFKILRFEERSPLLANAGGWHVLEREMGRFFLHMKAHYRPLEDERDCVLFYTVVPRSFYYKDDKITTRCVELQFPFNPSQMTSESSVTLENQDVGNILGHPDIVFLVQDSPVAIYYEYCNVLLCSDWVHSTDSAIFAIQHLWPQVFEGLKANFPRFRLARGIAERESEPPTPLFKMGTDPEFELVDSGGEVVPASEIVIPDSHNGPYCIGRDGSGVQLEIRPAPTSTAIELVSNIKSLIQECAENGLCLSLRGDRYPLGGHVHLSGFPLSEDVLYSLDDFVGEPLLNLSGYAREQYKRLSAYRDGKEHGGFEYRSLPSSWLWTPEFATYTLLIIEKLMHNGFRGFDYESGLPSREMAHQVGLSESESQEWASMIQRYANLRGSSREPIYPTGWGCEWHYKADRVQVSYYGDFSRSCRDVLSNMATRMGIPIHFIQIPPRRGIATNVEMHGEDWMHVTTGHEPRDSRGYLRVLVPYQAAHDVGFLRAYAGDLEYGIRRLNDEVGS